MATLLDIAKLPTRAIRQSVRGKTKNFFYSTAPTAVAAITGTVLGTTPTRINIDGDAHFVCTNISGTYVLNATGLQTDPQLQAEPEIQIQEEGTGFLLFDRPLRWFLVVGTGREPMVLDPPYIFPARSTVLVTFFNPETSIMSCQITLSGYKLYLR